MCYGSVQHIAVYTRASFMKKLQELLDDYEDFESLENVEKSSYVLGSELWESKFDGLLALNWLRNIIIVDVWEIRKHKLYDIVTQDLVCNFTWGEEW